MAEKPLNNKESNTADSITSDAESVPTMSSIGMDSSSFQLTVEKLNEKNYRVWAQSIKLVVDGKGKLGYLTGEKKQPTETNF